MKIRDFSSNEGTIKSPKNLKGKYCIQPFMNIDLHSNNGVRCCSESWMPAWIGDYSKNSIKEIWNMDMIKKIRQSIFDGTYEFCDWHQCPFYSNDEYYLYTKEELQDPSTLPEGHRTDLAKYKLWIQYILDEKIEVDIMPANYNLAYDETCNLKCPSCRDKMKIYKKGSEYEKRLIIHNKLIKEISESGLENIGKINMTGSGEPFISKIFSDFLFSFDGATLPKLDINIQSNGVLFDEEAWNKMHKIHNNINEVIISLDAAKSETYKKIRVNGDFDKLLKNIEFLSGLRKQNKIKKLMLAYVVQEKNFSEMVEALKIGKKYNIDMFIFNLLNDWYSWNKEEYEKNAIWKSFHPKYNEFLQVLTSPLFDDKIVDLGNMWQYRKEVLLKK